MESGPQARPKPTPPRLRAVEPSRLYTTREVAGPLVRQHRAARHRSEYVVPGREVLALAGGPLLLHAPALETETPAERRERDRADYARLDAATRVPRR